MSEPHSDPPFLFIAFLILTLLVALSVFGLRPANIIEVESEEEAKILAEQLNQIVTTLVLYTLIPLTVITVLFASRPPIALIIYDWFKEKYDLWYCKHFPHKIPFGEKWNRMLERLDYMAYLERKYGFHFNYEGDEK